MTRECGSCSMCCKLLSVEGVTERDTWCEHVVKGKGCAIYEKRPEGCRVFTCLWLADPGPGVLPDSFRPDKVKVVLCPTSDQNAVEAHVDPSFPDAYKKGRFGRYLRTLSQRMPVVIRRGEKSRIMLTPSSLSAWMERKRAAAQD